MPIVNRKKGGILRSLSFQFSRFQPSKNNDSNIMKNEVTMQNKEISGVQCYGILQKKCNKWKKGAAKWRKRFFVLKECFLLYYATGFEKTFHKKNCLEIHPKGFVALSDCSIVSGGDIGKKHCLLITHEHFKPAILCAPDFKTQEQWLNTLREATKISNKTRVENCAIIKNLEIKGLRLHQEKQTFYNKLQSEKSALREEIDKNDTLEKIKCELENEKLKLTRMIKKLKSDLQLIKQDLQITMETKKTLEQEKINLNTKTEHLVGNLETLEIEKTKIEEQMSGILKERETFLRENLNLSSVTSHLKKRLVEIESNTSKITTEKIIIEKQLRKNRQKTNDLESERLNYDMQTNELLSNLKELNMQKEMTENELKDEVIARIAAEKQLKAAEKALEHLEMALKLSGAHMTELREQIMPDVHKLREFFEECALEARMEANKPVIMKNAVCARRSVRKMNKSILRASFRRQNNDRKLQMEQSDSVSK